MTEVKESKTPFPFKISPDKEGFEPDNLTFRVIFGQSLNQQEREQFREAVIEWADKGIDKGYNRSDGGKMHDLLDEEEDFEWGQNWVELWVDMGVADSDDIKPDLEALFNQLVLKEFPIQEVKYGSGYIDWGKPEQRDQTN